MDIFRREDLHHLYLFYHVAKEGGFTRAAARLGLAQSSISRSISMLEKSINLQLLVRSTRKVALTSAGENHCVRSIRGSVNWKMAGCC